MTTFNAYTLLFIASIISGVSVFLIKDTNSKILKYITVFGGAFLLAVCFVDLIPAVFQEQECSHRHTSLIPLGVFILLGFVIQLLLEQISKGVEHGHVHPCSKNQNNIFSSLMLLLGVSIHAFLEGFPIVSEKGPNMVMITGIIIHNIPISIVLVVSFLNSGWSKFKSILLLLIFASMAILGSLLNQSWSFLHKYESVILALVVGILLHVSTTTLFDSEESHVYNIWRFLIVLFAFVVVCLMPAHVH